MKQILIAFEVPEECYAAYEEEFDFTVSLGAPMTTEELLEVVDQYDGIFVAGTRVNKEVLDKGSRLLVIGNNGVGYDNIDWKYATEKGVPVVNTPTQVTETTAEHAVALMMTTMRGIARYDDRVRRGEWGTPIFTDENMELHGRTLGILGFGRIGKMVCKKAQGLGMQVIYYDKFRASEAVEKEYNVTYMEFDEVLANSDCVTLHMPYVPENHHLFSMETFRKMKKDAYLINAARGPIVDEKALAEALETGVIRGAGLDVFEEEPKVYEALKHLDNVVMTPHVASAARRTRVLMAQEAIDGMVGVLRGEIPSNVINREVLEK